MTVEKQVPLTQKNVEIASRQTAGPPWLLRVAPADELAAKRIVCGGSLPLPNGELREVPAPVRDFRLLVEGGRPKGVWAVGKDYVVQDTAEPGGVASGSRASTQTKTEAPKDPAATPPIETDAPPGDYVRGIVVDPSDLQKVLDVVERALQHHALRDESNAALHLAAQVRLSPLTSELGAASDRLRALLA